MISGMNRPGRTLTREPRTRPLRALSVLLLAAAASMGSPAQASAARGSAGSPANHGARPAERIRILGTARVNAPSAHIARTQTARASLSPRTLSAASDEWLATGVAPALAGTNGEVMYPYGQSHPTITCAPLRLCVIELIPGERITNIAIGDSARWLVEETMAGSTPVLDIKPTAAGLETNLSVATTSRLYYLTLVSDKTAYTPMVGFYDPATIAAQAQAAEEVASAARTAAAATIKRRTVLPLGEVDPARLNFDFACTVRHHWWQSPPRPDFFPERVFQGGGHTYLEMPPRMKWGVAPAVFAVEGGQTALVNSRLVNGYIVIDGEPKKFQLAVGTGDHARVVICRRRHGRG